jgi:PGF-CTERM protein
MTGRSAAALALVCCLVVTTASVGPVSASVQDAPAVDAGRPTGSGGPIAGDGGTAPLAVADGTGNPDRNASFTVTDSNVSLSATRVPNGTTYDYRLSNPNAVTNFTIEVTGVETAETDTVSKNLTPGERWDLAIASDVEPTGPDGRLNPVIELTAHAYSWNSGYASDDGIEGTLFGDSSHSAHTIRSVPAGREIKRLTISGFSAARQGCAAVYMNEDGQNGAYGEGTQVVSNLCMSGSGSRTIQLDEPYTPKSDSVTVEFVSKIGGPVRVSLDEVSAERDGYENSRAGDQGNSLANLTVSTGEPSNVTVTDSVGDELSFGDLSDDRTVTKSMDLQTRDALTIEYDDNGADLSGTVRYREISSPSNPVVRVNGNRTAYQGTLSDGETVSLAAETGWLRAGLNTVTLTLDGNSADAPDPVVDLRYRHELGAASAGTATGTGTVGAAPASADTDARSPGGQETAVTAASDSDGTVVTDVSFRSDQITASETAVIVVTVSNPQPTVGTHVVELELFDQIVNSREVTVPAGGETQVLFVHTIVSPGTYTARVDSETATIRVVDPDRTATPAPAETTTSFPGFGIVVALLSLAIIALVARRD